MADNIMNRGEVVATVAADTGLAASRVDAVLKSFEGAIARALSSGSEVRMAGFGSFKVSQRAARTSRNPRTGEPVAVAARSVPRFTPGKGLKDAAGASAKSGTGAAKAKSNGGVAVAKSSAKAPAKAVKPAAKAAKPAAKSKKK